MLLCLRKFCLYQRQMSFAEFHTSTYPLRVLNIQRYMIHENTARTRTERVRVNTIHSLISLKKFCWQITWHTNTHPLKYFQTRECWKWQEPWSAFFNDVDNITPFIWNSIVYSELNYEVINYLLYSRDLA